MKKLSYFFISLLLISCNKDKNAPTPPVTTPGSISYKVNGTLVTMDNTNIANGEGVVFTKQLTGVAPKTRYLLNGQKGADHIIVTAIITDTLQDINYHYDSAYTANNGGLFVFTIDFNGQVGNLFYSGDYFDANITSYKNSRVTGTFTAKLSPITGSDIDYNHRGSLIITEGVFNNIPVTY